MRNLQLTESEENVLVQMACFFNDCGIPDDFDQDSYDSLFDKITDPSPFDYSWTHLNGLSSNVLTALDLMRQLMRMNAPMIHLTLTKRQWTSLILNNPFLLRIGSAVFQFVKCPLFSPNGSKSCIVRIWLITPFFVHTLLRSKWPLPMSGKQPNFALTWQMNLVMPVFVMRGETCI